MLMAHNKDVNAQRRKRKNDDETTKRLSLSQSVNSLASSGYVCTLCYIPTNSGEEVHENNSNLTEQKCGSLGAYLTHFTLHHPNLHDHELCKFRVNSNPQIVAELNQYNNSSNSNHDDSKDPSNTEMESSTVPPDDVTMKKPSIGSGVGGNRRKSTYEIGIPPPTSMPYPHHCIVCGKGFYRKKQSSLHLKNAHPWFDESNAELVARFTSQNTTPSFVSLEKLPLPLASIASSGKQDSSSTTGSTGSTTTTTTQKNQDSPSPHASNETTTKTTVTARTDDEENNNLKTKIEKMLAAKAKKKTTAAAKQKPNRKIIRPGRPPSAFKDDQQQLGTRDTTVTSHSATVVNDDDDRLVIDSLNNSNVGSDVDDEAGVIDYDVHMEIVGVEKKIEDGENVPVVDHPLTSVDDNVGKDSSSSSSASNSEVEEETEEEIVESSSDDDDGVVKLKDKEDKKEKMVNEVNDNDDVKLVEDEEAFKQGNHVEKVKDDDDIIKGKVEETAKGDQVKQVKDSQEPEPVPSTSSKEPKELTEKKSDAQVNDNQETPESDKPTVRTTSPKEVKETEKKIDVQVNEIQEKIEPEKLSLKSGQEEEQKPPQTPILSEQSNLYSLKDQNSSPSKDLLTEDKTEETLAKALTTKEHNSLSSSKDQHAPEPKHITDDQNILSQKEALEDLTGEQKIRSTSSKDQNTSSSLAEKQETKDQPAPPLNKLEKLRKLAEKISSVRKETKSTSSLKEQDTTPPNEKNSTIPSSKCHLTEDEKTIAQQETTDSSIALERSNNTISDDINDTSIIKISGTPKGDDSTTTKESATTDDKTGDEKGKPNGKPKSKHRDPLGLLGDNMPLLDPDAVLVELDQDIPLLSPSDDINNKDVAVTPNASIRVRSESYSYYPNGDGKFVYSASIPPPVTSSDTAAAPVEGGHFFTNYPLVCLFCGQGFYNRTKLKNHLTSKHANCYTNELEKSNSFVNLDYPDVGACTGGVPAEDIPKRRRSRAKFEEVMRALKPVPRVTPKPSPIRKFPDSGKKRLLTATTSPNTSVSIAAGQKRKLVLKSTIPIPAPASSRPLSTTTVATSPKKKRNRGRPIKKANKNITSTPTKKKKKKEVYSSITTTDDESSPTKKKRKQHSDSEDEEDEESSESDCDSDSSTTTTPTSKRSVNGGNHSDSSSDDNETAAENLVESKYR